MARKPKTDNVSIAPSSSGGPGTFRGTEYQIECATLKTLNLIEEQLGQPLRRAFIALEPRVVHQGAVTRWDVRSDPPSVLSEAKANLTKCELEEFLDRLSKTDSFAGSVELVFAVCSTPLLSAVKRLSQLAIECGRDASKFDELVTRERIPQAQFVLGKLGPSGRTLLPQIVFENLPEGLLKRETESRCRLLCSEHPAGLLDSVSRHLRDAAKLRRQLDIGELVNSIEKEGLTLTRPTKIELHEIAPEALSALAMLEAASNGLPEEVVVDLTETSAAQLMNLLSGVNWVSTSDRMWRLRSLPFKVPVQNRSELLCRTFESLLNFLNRNETDNRAESQVLNALSFARMTLNSRPALSLPFFQAAEHVVKNLGDKHLLLEISYLCIDASTHGAGIDAESCARARAQAMLCGTSWVYQRTDRLQEARVWAEKSLKLGEDIGWERNTAFAKKCMGRLERMEAEHHQIKSEDRARLTEASVVKLREAIDIFPSVTELGPLDRDRQIGDCYSLLARTYLTARKRSETEDALRQAYQFLTRRWPKEFSDLLILEGDYEVTWGSRDQAEIRYSEVIETLSRDSREHSEIYARALSGRARNRFKLGMKRAALSDFERAGAIWRELGEHEEAAKNEWGRIEAQGNVELSVLKLFSSEPKFLSRLTAFNIYRDDLRQSKALAHRARPSENQVNQYLKEARRRAALDYPEW
jgi:tetratricopeptide (TPR) repeat protein